jgi:hypothetical protein
MKKLLGVLVCVLLLVAPISAVAIPVDLELALVIDSSGSINAAEFALQRDAYEAAFRNAAIIQAIQEGAIGSIAASIFYFSGTYEQAQPVGWTQINDSSSANAFADLIAATARPYGGGTHIGNALSYAADTFAANGFEGTRELIDISSDGFSDPSTTAAGRDYALNTVGIDTINGLAIGPGADVQFFVDAVIGGPNAFVMYVDTFERMAQAVSDKIIREVQEPVIPEPGTLMLFGVGLIGVFALGRKKFFKN